MLLTCSNSNMCIICLLIKWIIAYINRTVKSDQEQHEKIYNNVYHTNGWLSVFLGLFVDWTFTVGRALIIDVAKKFKVNPFVLCH